MRSSLDVSEARAWVRTRSDLVRYGWTDRTIEQAVGEGSLRRVQRNRYVRQEEWGDLWPESRHLLQVVAACGEMRGGAGVVSHESAAVLHGLPLYHHLPRGVHFTMPRGSRASARPGLVRHHDAIGDDDVSEVDGIRCTSLERTAFDVMRTAPVEVGVAVADVALSRAAGTTRDYDQATAGEWRARMRWRSGLLPGARGVRRAAQLIDFADGRAESPGESVSRLRLMQVGFQRFGLQVAVPGPDGRPYRLDLELEEARCFFEFDGKAKYLDPDLRAGRTVEQVMLAEKQREDWIRGKTQKRLVRAQDEHIGTVAALAARLAAFGIHPPPRA